MEDEKKELYTILYISTMKTEYSKEGIEDMLKKYRKNNSKNNISGLMLYYEKNIIQCIEGHKQDVDKLYTFIKSDKRHYNVIKVFDEKICTRYFKNWDMGFKYLNCDKDFKSLSYDEFKKESLDKLEFDSLHQKKIKVFFKQFLDSFGQH